MIIPIGFGGAGGAGGKPYILIFAELPQYIAGKYITVSLSGVDIFANTIPDDVNSVQVDIEEAGLYTVKVYASSSATSAEETKTVNVESLTADYSVKIGENLYVDESEVRYYYKPSNTAVKTSSTVNGSASGNNISQPETSLYSSTWTAPYGGRIKLTVTGTIKWTNANYSYQGIVTARLKHDSTIAATISISSGSTSGETKTDSIEGTVEAGVTYTLEIVAKTSYTGSMTASNVVAKVCGTAISYTFDDIGYIAKSVKSIQMGVRNSGADTTFVTINAVNPDKSIVIYNSNSGYTYREKPLTPILIELKYASSTNYNIPWCVIEYY